MSESLNVEQVEVSDLNDHPRNYKVHTEDQLVHIVKSIEDHGFYKNIVVARDNTILAGHGVVKGARKMGITEVPVVRLDIEPDDPRALRVLAGDNEIARLAQVDDRALTELLKEVGEDIDGLLGTGFDEMMLANLVFITRPETEIEDLDAASEWAGMPEYEVITELPQVIVSFKDGAARDEFVAALKADATVLRTKGKAWSLRWPPSAKHDWKSVSFESDNGAAEPSKGD